MSLDSNFDVLEGMDVSTKPKTKVSRKIPKDFVSFMSDTDKRIANGDKATTVLSDDLLQCGSAYGGLYDKEAKRFSFRFLKTDTETWDFDLGADQIADIASGQTLSVDFWQCSNTECGCLYAAAEAYCGHCDNISDFEDYESRLKRRNPEADTVTLHAECNLRKMGLALWGYHHQNGHFPPVQTYDSAGMPLHSWRTLLLPFLDEQNLFEKIDMSQPWDSETNRMVWKLCPTVYKTVESDEPHCSFVAVRGEETLWPENQICSVGDITSGTSFTVAVLCVNGPRVNWMAPVDTDVASALVELKSNSKISALLVDGHTRTFEVSELEEFEEHLSIK